MGSEMCIRDRAGHASVGLAALAMGAVGLRRRRKAATTAA